MSKKHSYEYVKEYIESFGYTLLSKEYKNAHTKLKIKCDKNHIFVINWNDFQQGRRCGICYGNKKHSYEYVKEYVESFGYTLLSKEYKNNRTKLQMQCDKGHEFEMI